MKNKIYIFGIVCVLLILTGVMFKIQHWSGAGVLLTFGFSIFVLGFMLIALMSSFRTETDKKLKRLYVIAYICVFIECMGTLFKIQYWPGAGILLIIGIPLPFVLFLPAYLLEIRKNKQLNYNNLLLVLFFFAYFAAITALLALNVSRNILDEYIISANNFEQQAKTTNNQTLAMIESLPTNNAKDSIIKESVLKIRAKSSSLFKMIDNMKVGIIKNVNSNNEQAIDAEGHINLWEVNGLDNRTIYYREIFISKSKELKSNLLEFKKTLLTSIGTKDVEVTDYINHILNTPDNWQFAKFEGKHLIAIIDALNSIKSNVALAELETISTLDGSSI